MIRFRNNAAAESARLARVSRIIPDVLDKALARWALLAHRSSLEKLSGEGSKYQMVTSKAGRRYKRRPHGKAPAGGTVPVPVRTGQLRRSESYVTPGHTKSGLSARHGQAALFNSARYAHAVHEGAGPHSAFGPRRFVRDAINDTRKDGFESSEFSRSLHRVWVSSGSVSSGSAASGATS